VTESKRDTDTVCHAIQWKDQKLWTWCPQSTESNINFIPPWPWTMTFWPQSETFFSVPKWIYRISLVKIRLKTFQHIMLTKFKVWDPSMHERMHTCRISTETQCIQPYYTGRGRKIGLERYQTRHPIPNNIGLSQCQYPMPIPIPVRDEMLNWMQVKNCASQHTMHTTVTYCHEFNLKLNLDYFNLNI